MGNMDIWNRVEKTDPNHTKRVELGRKFTAIDAHYQIKSATEAFGPVGVGWGYLVSHDTISVGATLLAVADVTLWHGSRDNSFGPFRGMAEIVGSKEKVDDDAAKKAMTDAITKGLSHLGFNADVFLGLFDDNKYVKQVTQEFSSKKDGQAQEIIQGIVTALSERDLSVEWLMKQAEAAGWPDASMDGIAENETWRDWARELIKAHKKKGAV